MDDFPVDDQDSSALYVAGVNKSSSDAYPSCDLCRHGYHLRATCNTTKCTKVMLLSALGLCSTYANSQGQFKSVSEVVYRTGRL